MDIKNLLAKQREFFASGKTLSIDFRIAQLKKLKTAVEEYEPQIAKALKADLGKSDYESFMCETGMVKSEIGYMSRNVKRLAKAKTVVTPLAQFHSKSYTLPSPYGCTLVMSPWNYPFLLSMDPLVDSIAAGNTCIVKPSAYSPETSELIEKIVSECFDPSYAAVVTGGREENAALLNERFDMIFFTGSLAVGKHVLKMAADNVTPVVLELGGKSPCIVDQSADIKLAAKRIVFGKYLNCGQTCIAPDYILCHSGVKDKFLREVKLQLKSQFGPEPLANPNYGKIINRKHFDRIKSLIDTSKVVFGGKCDDETLRIEPTVMDNVTWHDAVMGEEIFGPIMPVLTFDSISDVFSNISNAPTPLALYLFSANKENIERITKGVSFGGGCINDTIIHLATSNMGFGGVGTSGMGSYHGKDGFEVFSHRKSIVDKKTWLDLPMRYQPYKKGINEKLLHMFLR